MRLIGKLLALPFMLVTGILYLVCKFLVVLSGAVLGILSGIIFLAALVLFFVAGFLPGLAWLMIAFLISPSTIPIPYKQLLSGKLLVDFFNFYHYSCKQKESTRYIDCH